MLTYWMRLKFFDFFRLWDIPSSGQIRQRSKIILVLIQYDIIRMLSSDLVPIVPTFPECELLIIIDKGPYAYHWQDGCLTL